MKTIRTKQIDGFIIVTGESIPGIGPRETQLANTPAILALPESAALRNKYQEKVQHIVKGAQAKKKAQHALEIKNMKDYAKYNKEYLDRGGAENTANTEMIALKKAVNVKAKDILRSNPVHFENREGEFREGDAEIGGKTVDEILSLHLAKGQNQQLKIDGVYVDDFRGCQYNYYDGAAWMISEAITALDVAEDNEAAIEAADLSDGQREEIRFQKLSAEDKTAEYVTADEALLAKSIDMRMGLEIQGVSKASALTQSQDFYNTELAILKAKYGIT